MGQGRAVNQGLKVGGHFTFYREATLSVKKDVIYYKYFLSIAYKNELLNNILLQSKEVPRKYF